MARLYQTGFELNSVTSNVEFNQFYVGNNGAIQTTTVRSGTYALQVNSMSSGTSKGVDYQFVSADNNGPFYFRTYFNVGTYPTAENTIIYLVGNPGASTIYITISSTGLLRLYDEVGQIGSASLALSLNAWYSLEIQFDRTGGAGASIVKARINSTQFAGSITRTESSGISAIQLGGNLNAEAQTTGNFFFDDVAVNDSTGSFQNSWCGEGKIIHLKPSAAGDSNGFTVGVGGVAGQANNFTRVQEIPPDDATTYNGSAVLNAEDLFNCDNTSGISMSDTINVVAVGARIADLVSADALAAFKFEIESAASGTKSQSADVIPNSTAWITNSKNTPRNYPLVTYQTPNGLPWTQTTLDSMQIGYLQDVTNVQTIAVSTIWASIDYTPATTGRPSTLDRHLSVGNGMSRSEGVT